MTETISNDKNRQLNEVLNHHWKALLVFAAIVIAAGIGCLISPNVGSISIDKTLAAGLLLSCIPLAFMTYRSRERASRLFFGMAFIVSAIIGGFLFLRPEAGVIVITIAIMAWFVLHGIYKLILSFNLTDFLDRGMATLSSMLNFAAAILIFKFAEDTDHNPEALAAGVGLIFSGIVWVHLALRHRKI